MSIEDEAVGVFGQKEAVAKLTCRLPPPSPFGLHSAVYLARLPAARFDLGSGFTTHDDVQVALIEAEDFFSVDDLAFPNDAFMGLAAGLRQLIEHVVDAGQNDFGLGSTQIGLPPTGIERVAVSLAVSLDEASELFERTEDRLAFFFAAGFTPTRCTHSHGQRVDFAQQALGLGHAMA